jgi:Fur family transcriptional regulator, ferric uptake regulator
VVVPERHVEYGLSYVAGATSTGRSGSARPRDDDFHFHLSGGRRRGRCPFSPRLHPRETAGPSEPHRKSSAVSPRESSPLTTRNTRQRVAVVSVLTEVDEFRSAQELHDLLRHQGESVGLTTVYRTLQALAEADEVDSLRREDGETVYRRCSQGHHHHLVCRSCGHTVEVAGPAVERWADRVAQEHGFTEVDHTVEIFGYCSGCAREPVR